MFCLFVVIPSVAQNTNTSLLRTLAKLEKKFDVRFSYNRKDIKPIEIPILPDSLNLQQSLAAISENSAVSFTQIKERYIAVLVNSIQKTTVCGILIETETGVPINDAELVLNGRSMPTDEGGNFRFEDVPKNETLSVVVNGFLVRTIAVAELNMGTACPFVYVSQVYTYLPEVVLQNFITKGISKNVEGAITISNENFDILPSLIEPDILQIAQALPGIESADETAANLNVRGGTSDEFLIVWDDIRMYQTGHFFGLISAFNPNLTKNVTIYKNGTAARYGEGVSGVIAMESNNSIPEKFQGAVGVNLTSANAYAEIPATDRFLITVSGRSSLNTGIGNPVYNEFFSKVFQNTVVTNLQDNSVEGIRSTDEEFNFYDLSLKTLWKITDRDELTYQLLSIDNLLQFTELFVAETSGSRLESELEQQNTSQGISWGRTWNRANTLTSKVSAFTSTYRRNEFTINVDQELFNSNQNRVQEKGIKSELSYTPSKELQLTGGYQYTDTEITDAVSNAAGSSINSTTKSRYSNALFVQSTVTLFDSKTTLSGGLRFTEYPTISRNFLEPRLHIDQKLNAFFRLQFSGELKHQSIYQTVNVQNNLLGVETRDWLLADGLCNPFLESKQVGAGLNFNNRGWTLAVDGYLKDVTGINTQNLGFRNQLQDQRFIGSYYVEGIEFSANKRTSNINVWLSYAYQDNTYTFDDFSDSTFRNQLDSAHSLTIAGSIDYKNFSFSLGNTFKSGLPYTKPVLGNEIITTEAGSVINFETPNAETLPSYFRSDFSASYDLKLDETFSGKINIAFLNLLNRKNQLDRYYILDRDDSGLPTLRQVDQFSLGFTPNISLQLRF